MQTDIRVRALEILVVKNHGFPISHVFQRANVMSIFAIDGSRGGSVGRSPIRCSISTNTEIQTSPSTNVSLSGQQSGRRNDTESSVSPFYRLSSNTDTQRCSNSPRLSLRLRHLAESECQGS